MRYIPFVFFCLLFLGSLAKAEFEVDPLYEGVYNVDLICHNKADKICMKYEGEFHLVVMNTIGKRGTSVSLHQVPYHNRLYTFAMGSYENRGAIIEGWEVIEDSGRFGEFHIEIDPVSRNVTGWLQDSAMATYYDIRGEQQLSTSKFYSREVLSTTIAVEDLLGRYVGKTVPRGELFLRKRRTSGSGFEMIAGWTNDGATVTTGFDYVEYIPERAVLNLVDYHADGGSVKWTFSVSKEIGPVTLTGVLFSSSNVAIREMSFVNAGPLIP